VELLGASALLAEETWRSHAAMSTLSRLAWQCLLATFAPKTHRRARGPPLQFRGMCTHEQWCRCTELGYGCPGVLV